MEIDSNLRVKLKHDVRKAMGEKTHPPLLGFSVFSVFFDWDCGLGEERT